MAHDAYGYGYNTEGTTIKLALVVMVAYCVFAIVHIIYLGLTGISSTAWDSTAEMMVLAMNSSPTKHLQNTCAGIIGIKPFQTLVRVLATNGIDHKADHLELVFGNIEQSNFKRLEVNQEYGRVHMDGDK